MARASVLLLLLALSGCLVGSGRGPITAAQYLHGVRSALRAGDFDLASRLMERVRLRHPADPAVRLWSAEVASMEWRDEDALHDLTVLRERPADTAFTPAEVEGKLGELLFRMGRYGESAQHLIAGQVGDHGASRSAFAEIVRHLPYEIDELDFAVAELPLEVAELPYLVCGVGDEQQAFVLDTRATLTTLGSSLATELGVSPVLPAGMAVDGTGRPVESSVGVLSRLSLGGIEIGPLPVLVVPDRALQLRGVSGGAERPPRALVGQDVLRRFRVTFDPARRSVVLQRPRGLDPKQSQQCLWVEQNLLVSVSIEGRDLWFALDTGASASSLSASGLQSLPDGERRALETFSRVYSPGGVQFSVRKVQGLVFQVSDVRFRGVELQVIEREEPKVFPVHGVLGSDLLMQCRITLDSGRIRLESL